MYGYITLSEAARQLGVNRTDYIQGLLVGLGIRPTPLGNALVITQDEMRRLRKRVKEYKGRDRVTAK